MEINANTEINLGNGNIVTVEEFCERLFLICNVMVQASDGLLLTAKHIEIVRTEKLAPSISEILETYWTLRFGLESGILGRWDFGGEMMFDTRIENDDEIYEMGAIIRYLNEGLVT